MTQMTRGETDGNLSGAAQQEMILRERAANSVWRKLRRNKGAFVGFLIVATVVFTAIFGPALSGKDPNKMNFAGMYAKPGERGMILGGDEFGRDLFTRIVYGARVSILVSVGGMSVGAVAGVLLGLLSGFKGGILDSFLMRVMDGMFAFPFILLALLLLTTLGEGIQNVILAIGIANVPGYARVVRGQVLFVKNEEYIKSVAALGASNTRLIFAHILPNVFSQVIVYATLNVAGAILTEASLSFLGMGITPPTASWGGILKTGQDCLQTAPHLALYSGLAILLTVLGFNLLGDGIRDVLDPKMKT
jgi:peptide/nickel transport system permease protein